MIVYGDPQFAVDAGEFAAQQCKRLINLLHSSTLSLDSLRSFLILTGQLEQAITDSVERQPASASQLELITQVNALTLCAARAFHSAWSTGEMTSASAALNQMRAGFERLMELSGIKVTVKVPEGFAFYALYPEQYCVAARHWLADHRNAVTRHVAVIGIRSIGTTAGALVAATLENAGWKVTSFTVRPNGHPYSRRVDIRGEQIKDAEWGLVVDEGPGMSGSSMAAAAEALNLAGLTPSHIAFLPSHAGLPGKAASSEVSQWWQSTRRYVGSLAELSFGGTGIASALAHASEQFTNGRPPTQVEDASAGLWRRSAYAKTTGWPSVCAPFERPKYRCITNDGKAVLWKFTGWPAVAHDLLPAHEREIAVLTLRYDNSEHRTVPALGSEHGYVATAWIGGHPLSRVDATPALLAQIGQHIALTALAYHSDDEHAGDITRISEMLYWNTWEALGESTANKAKRWWEPLYEAIRQAASQAYGDGRLAPHEWLRTPEGVVVKVDCAGHACDHTVVGHQSVAWDIAGAIVEWQLSKTQTAVLLDAFQHSGGDAIPPAVLTFYQMAYVAFRAGQCSMCAGLAAHDPTEQRRLWRAYHDYVLQLRSSLESIGIQTSGTIGA